MDLHYQYENIISIDWNENSKTVVGLSSFRWLFTAAYVFGEIIRTTSVHLTEAHGLRCVLFKEVSELKTP
jgi:hypothetical protein